MTQLVENIILAGCGIIAGIAAGVIIYLFLTWNESDTL